MVEARLARARLSRPSGFAVAAAALLVVEAAAVLLLSVDHRHEILGGDGPEYGRYAENLLEHGSYSSDSAPPYDPSVNRTPGYPLFLAALRLLGGDSVLLVRVVQFALVGVLATLVYRIALRVAGRREARIAALLTLTYLPLIWLARYQLTEVLASLLAAAAVLLLLPPAAGEALRSRRHAVAGVALGVATLVRPSFALVALIAAVALSSGGRWRPAAVLLTACAVTLAPWVARNVLTAHSAIPLGASSGQSLYASAKQYSGDVSPAFTEAEWTRFRAGSRRVAAAAVEQESRRSGEAPLSVRRELAANRAYRLEAHDIMRDIGIAELLGRLPQRVAYLWAPSDFPPRASYGFWHPIAQLQHAVLALCGVLGLAVLVRRRIGWDRMWPLLLVPAYLTALHLVFHVEARYSMPGRPMLLALSAIGVAAAVQRLAEARASKRVMSS